VRWSILHRTITGNTWLLGLYFLWYYLIYTSLYSPDVVHDKYWVYTYCEFLWSVQMFPVIMLTLV
jgi:hypothetical protein